MRFLSRPFRGTSCSRRNPKDNAGAGAAGRFSSCPFGDRRRMSILEAIGAKLVKLRVLSEAQWQKASFGDPSTSTLLDRLARTPGRWFDPNAEKSFALTD